MFVLSAEKTPEKREDQEQFFTITGDTLKKCSHEHDSHLLEGCSEVHDHGTSSPYAVDGVKQKLFEKEIQEMHKYDIGIEQTLDVDWYEWNSEESNATIGSLQNESETCTETHHGQISYLKCRICNANDFENWEEY